MKNIVNENGDIILLSKEGRPTKVGSLKHGITYNVFRSNAKKIAKVTLKTGSQEDEFFFFDNGNPAFHHVQNRDLHPNLILLYLRYFADEEHFSPKGFIEFMCMKYFAELGYTFRE